MSRTTVRFTFILAASLSGCSHRPAEYLPATGEFVFEDGLPLAGVTGLVRFTPVQERHERASSSGDLQPDGTFELETYETQYAVQHEGVRVGDYNVVLLEFDQEDSPRVVPEKYRHFEESPWRANVTAEGPNHFKFVVERLDGQDAP